MTVRKVGVWCSLTAVVAFGLAVIADNRNLGFGYTSPAGISFFCLPWR
jgi:hypothetical protein